MTAPAEEQLKRLAAFATIAWGDAAPIRFGFRVRKTGVTIYVRQRKRFGNSVEQEGKDADAVVKSMERILCVIGSETTGKSEEFLRSLVDQALAKGRSRP